MQQAPAQSAGANVPVRFLVRDEQRQFSRAQRLLRREAERGEPVFVSHLVLLETEWVLRSRYGLSKAEISWRVLWVARVGKIAD